MNPGLAPLRVHVFVLDYSKALLGASKPSCHAEHLVHHLAEEAAAVGVMPARTRRRSRHIVWSQWPHVSEERESTKLCGFDFLRQRNHLCVNYLCENQLSSLARAEEDRME